MNNKVDILALTYFSLEPGICSRKKGRGKTIRNCTLETVFKTVSD